MRTGEMRDLTMYKLCSIWRFGAISQPQLKLNMRWTTKGSNHFQADFQSSSPMTVFFSSESSKGILSSCASNERRCEELFSAGNLWPDEWLFTHRVNLDERFLDQLDRLEQIFLLDDQGRSESNTTGRDDQSGLINAKKVNRGRTYMLT